MPRTTLYFAYASFLDPDRISSVAPGARFLFTAHYPETRLDFFKHDEIALPTLTHDPGHTVWGGVFEIPDEEVASLTAAEASEGRSGGFDHKAVDREGNKYDCLTFVAKAGMNGETLPDAEYLAGMVRGARHWNLPAGWVMGLEDLSEDPLFN